MTAVRHETGPDAGAVWHYGDPIREQRRLAAGEATVDMSHRPTFSLSGPDRLSWLNNIASQKLDDLAPGQWTTAYILDPQGRISHVFGGIDDGETLWASTEPGRLDALLAWLRRMQFAARVEIVDRSDTHAMVIAGGPRIVPREELDEVLGEQRAGTWAADALRIEAGQPRTFVDTDDKTIPNELANPDGLVLGAGVHLQKGCYPGQETVARVYTLGRPPRRLTRLHLDGTAEALPAVGADVVLDGRVVGRVGSSARHHELGPIALALIKRNVSADAQVLVDGIDASQELIVDPEVGLHVRPRLR
ncbi:folate-binding protein [Micropruina sp.]|uniref:CAF17-like 4Fe-4S cluster assembly/insertion protein YgfZ n=1 Tax=Micropruina sp. TaxID=2737536 RepID=UPI002635B15A|nr:folate-binding protein [Micropruina sp.]